MDKKCYTDGKITVTWQPSKCCHSGMCVKTLPTVFDVSARPWINMDGASCEEIMKAIDSCPSGALSYETNSK